MSNDIVVLMLQGRGMPGSGISEIEKSQILSDISSLLGRPVVAGVGDLNDVDISGIADGNTLVYDAGSQAFVGKAIESGVVDPVDHETTIVGTFDSLQAFRPVRFSEHPTLPGVLRISVITGTSAGTVAEGNHIHNNPLPVFEPFSASGYMSGGSRQVVSRSVTLAAGVPYAVIARFRPQLRGADPGAAYYTLTTTIAGNPRTSPGGATSGFWCVQGVPNNREWVHAREIVGTGTSITVTGSVAYHSGAGFNVDAGELEIELKPSR